MGVSAIGSLWPITAVPHAILEYYLVDRLAKRVLDRLTPVLGDALMQPLPRASLGKSCAARGRATRTPQVVRTSTGNQLAWLFVFVSLMPMCVLGASVRLKLPVNSLSKFSPAWAASTMDAV